MGSFKDFTKAVSLNIWVELSKELMNFRVPLNFMDLIKGRLNIGASFKDFLKLVSAIFHEIFIFHQMIGL